MTTGIALSREATRTSRDLPFIVLPPDFTKDAACDEHRELFNLVGYERVGWAGAHKQAKDICGGCPVREQCLELAMRAEGDRMGYRYGMFGGLNPKERSALARQRAKAVRSGL